MQSQHSPRAAEYKNAGGFPIRIRMSTWLPLAIVSAALVIAANVSLGAALTSQGLVIIANGLLFMVAVAELTRAAFTLALLPRR